MRLRERKDRRPGRYREHDPDDTDFSLKHDPPVGRVEYNPSLPKAAFPTVPLGTWAPGRQNEDAATEAATGGMVVGIGPLTVQSNTNSGNSNNSRHLQQGNLPWGAEIQGNEIQSPVVPPLIWKAWDDIPGQSCNWEEGRTPFLTGSRPSDPLTAVGEDYNGFVTRIMQDPDGTTTSRYFIESYPEDISWRALPEGIQLFIVRELCRERSIYQTWNFLELSNQDRLLFSKIYNRELFLEQAEMPHIEQFTKKITNVILSGGFYSMDEISDIYEEGLGGENAVKSPTAFFFSKRDIEQAVKFLEKYECQKCGYVDRAIDRIKILEGMSATWREMEFDQAVHPDFDEEDHDKSEDDEDISDWDPFGTYRARLQSDAAPSVLNEPTNDGLPPISHMLIQEQNSRHPSKRTRNERGRPRKAHKPSPADDLNKPLVTADTQEYCQLFEIAETAHLSHLDDETIKVTWDDKLNYTCKGKHETRRDMERKKELERIKAAHDNWMALYNVVHGPSLNENPFRNNTTPLVVNSGGVRIDRGAMAVTNSQNQNLVPFMPTDRGSGSDFRGAEGIIQDPILQQDALNRRYQEPIPIDPRILNAELEGSHTYSSALEPPASALPLPAKNPTPVDTCDMSRTKVPKFKFVQFSPSGASHKVTRRTQAPVDTQLPSASGNIISKTKLRLEDQTSTSTTQTSKNLLAEASRFTAPTCPITKVKLTGKRAITTASRAPNKATKANTRSAKEVPQEDTPQDAMNNMRSDVNTTAYKPSSYSPGPDFIDDMTYNPNPQPRPPSPLKPRPGSPGFGSQPTPTIVLGQSTYIDRIRNDTNLFITHNGGNKQTSVVRGPLPQTQTYSLPQRVSCAAAITTARQECTPTINLQTKAVDSRSSSSSDCSILVSESFGSSEQARQGRGPLSGIKPSTSGPPPKPRGQLLGSIYDSSSDSDILPTKAVKFKDKPRGKRFLATGCCDSLLGQPTTPSDKITAASSDTISDGRETRLPEKFLLTKRKKLYHATSTPVDLKPASSFVQGTPDLPNRFVRTLSSTPAHAASGILPATPTGSEVSKMPGARTPSFIQKLQEAKNKSGPRTGAKGKVARGTAPGALTSTPTNGTKSQKLPTANNSHQAHLPISASKMNNSAQTKNHFSCAQGQHSSGGHSAAGTPSNQPILRASLYSSAPPTQSAPSEYHHSSQHSDLAGRAQSNHARPKMTTLQQPPSQNNSRNNHNRQTAVAAKGLNTRSILASESSLPPESPESLESLVIELFSDHRSTQIFRRLSPLNQAKISQCAASMKNPPAGYLALKAPPPAELVARSGPALDKDIEDMFYLPCTFYNGHIMSRQNFNPPMLASRGASSANQNTSTATQATKSAASVNPGQSKLPTTNISGQNALPTSPNKRDTRISYSKSPCPTNSKPLSKEVPKFKQGSAAVASGVSKRTGKGASSAVAMNTSSPEATTMGQFVPIKKAAPSGAPLTSESPQAAAAGQKLGPGQMVVGSGSQSEPVARYRASTTATDWAMDQSGSDFQKRVSAAPLTLEENTKLAVKKKLDASRQSSAAPSEASVFTGKGKKRASRRKKGMGQSGPMEETPQDRGGRYAKRQMMSDGSPMDTTSVDKVGDDGNL